MGLPAIESNGTSHDTEALYREHGVAVARFCSSLLRDHAEAEDATQQVFLSAHRALLNGSVPREPLAWLLAVARHECYARFRQRPAAPAPDGEVADVSTPDASVHVFRAGEIATMWEEVSRMPSAQREAFLLREIRGLSYSQLAAELSLSAPSVRSLLVRARRRLRHRLRDVTAGLGGAPWIQTLVRLVGGGDGASPVPAATKAAAVGIGALALVGGGDLSRVQHHASSKPRYAVAQHRAHARVSHASTSVAASVARNEDRPGRVGRRTELGHSQRSGDGSHESGSGGSGSHEGSGQLDASSSGGPSGSGHEGSGDTTAVTAPSADGHDGGTSTDSGRNGGSSGSSSGSDGGSAPTTTSSDSDGGGSGGGDGGGSSGPGG